MTEQIHYYQEGIYHILVEGYNSVQDHVNSSWIEIEVVFMIKGFQLKDEGRAIKPVSIFFKKSFITMMISGSVLLIIILIFLNKIGI